MPFWNELNLEPKRKFRWMLFFAGLPQFIVKSVKKPSVKIGTKAHDFLNYKFNYPGKLTWDPIDFTIIDPIQPDATHSFMEIIKNAGYDMPNQFVTLANSATDGMRSITKESMSESFGGQIQLVQYATQPNTENPAKMVEVEKWLIHNPLITSVNFGDLSYASEDIIEIKVGITYDWAELEAGTGGEQKFTLEAPTGALDLTGPQGGQGE